MGDRNHLHVCRHCGIVHATTSPTAPRRCIVCGAIEFSRYELNGLVEERIENAPPGAEAMVPARPTPIPRP